MVEFSIKINHNLDMENLINPLLQSDEPIIRYKALAHLTPSPDTTQLQSARQAIVNSSRVQGLLKAVILDHPYQKWLGAHWVLAQLADVEYPAGDELLLPLREAVLSWLFSKKHWDSIKTINGLTRRCASQESNALYSMLVLGIAEEHAEELAGRLIRWQWPDGGWNCDRRPQATHSSFYESILPWRALTLYARISGDPHADAAAKKCADHFLERKLFQSLSTGQVILPNFIRLHYPCYWHYDILMGLRVANEADLIQDPRCLPALDLLYSKLLPTGGFPAEERYYQVTQRPISNRSSVDWGPVSAKMPNPFVTVEALRVLKSAGRI